MNPPNFRIHLRSQWCNLIDFKVVGKIVVPISLLITLLVSEQISTLAQGNYVVNTANNTSLGTYNTLVGPGTNANASLTGDRNTVTGYNSGFYLTSGNKNSFFGVDVGKFTTTGSENTFMGFEAGFSNTSGGSNTLLGRGAGYTNTSGYGNAFVGFQAGYKNTTGSQNAFIATYAGYSNTTGGANTYIGYQAGYSNTTGATNTFMGYLAGLANTTGSNNAFLGSFVGGYNTTGSNNVFVGTNAGSNNTTGYSNISLGFSAAYGNQTGHNNVVIGDSAGYNNSVSGNVFVGSKAGYTNSTGTQNTCLGYQAGYNSTAIANTFIGYQAGRNVTTGSNNIIIGPTSGTAITNGNDNVLMGYNSQADKGIFNGIAIGSGSRVASSNALILGKGVNVGIGTSTPKSKLEVVADEADQSGLRLSSLTNDSPTAITTDQFLTVDGQGNVIKARYQLRINSPAEWSDNVFDLNYSLRSLASVATYISQHGHLPGVPSAEQVVKKGVDLVKMNTTLLEKVEELTLYSIQQDKKIDKQQQEIDQLKGLVKQLLEKK